jgi:hypothetical protein
LTSPVFPTLPKVKAFQLQLLDAAFKDLGIGVLPIKQIILGIASVVLAYTAYDYIITHKKELPATFVAAANPYQAYLDQLTSPDPAKVLHELSRVIDQLFSIPGWQPTALDLSVGTPGKLRVQVLSTGGSTETLLAWANRHDAKVEIMPDGLYINFIVLASRRDAPTSITSMQNILSAMLDRMTIIMPDNPIKIGPIADKKDYLDTNVTLTLNEVSTFTLDIIGRYIQGLPLVLVKFDGHMQDGYIFKGCRLY